MPRGRTPLINGLTVTVATDCPSVEGWRMAIRMWYRITEEPKRNQSMVCVLANSEINNSSKENPEVPKFTPFTTQGRSMREMSGRGASMGEISSGGAD